MEAWFNPAVLVPVTITAVGVIIWLVRLEAKVNAAVEDIAEKLGETKATLDTLRTRFYEHVTNNSLHHNEQAVMEFRTALERRFTGVESSLTEIKGQLRSIANGK